MIHAYLHIVSKEQGRTVKPHGPEFQQKSREISQAMNINITTRHSYVYWYRCDGSCQNHETYLFGYLNSVVKLQPSSSCLYTDHHAACGGTYQETTEPSKKLLNTINKQYRKMKSTWLKRKKTAKPAKERLTLRFKRPYDPKHIEYASTDDEV